MKKIISQATSEVAEHYSDFNGERSYSRLTIQCGMGSDYSGHLYQFDISDADIRDILVFIQLKLPQGKTIKDDQFFDS